MLRHPGLDSLEASWPMHPRPKLESNECRVPDFPRPAAPAKLGFRQSSFHLDGQAEKRLPPFAMTCFGPLNLSELGKSSCLTHTPCAANSVGQTHFQLTAHAQFRIGTKIADDGDLLIHGAPCKNGPMVKGRLLIADLRVCVCQLSRIIQTLGCAKRLPGRLGKILKKR